jgi:hypothetical protein
MYNMRHVLLVGGNQVSKKFALRGLSNYYLVLDRFRCSPKETIHYFVLTCASDCVVPQLRCSK